jgi:hypothetical protein
MRAMLISEFCRLVFVRSYSIFGLCVSIYMPEGNLYDYLHKRNNTLELLVVLWMGIGISKGMDYEKPSGQYLGLICDKSLTC